MDTEHILAMRSHKDEILLFDETDKFKASFQNGKWIDATTFNFDDLWDNFDHMTNDDEIMRLMEEARAALGQPLKQAKAG